MNPVRPEYWQAYLGPIRDNRTEWDEWSCNAETLLACWDPEVAALRLPHIPGPVQTRLQMGGYPKAEVISTTQAQITEDNEVEDELQQQAEPLSAAA